MGNQLGKKILLWALDRPFSEGLFFLRWGVRRKILKEFEEIPPQLMLGP